MPLQELSPLPPVTGYAQLGNVLSNLGQDQLQRSRQLEDVASARQYASTEGDKRRKEMLQDAQTMEKFRNREAGIRLLINDGYLNESQVDDENAINAARAKFMADGQDKIYNELFNTPDPDTGKPLLSHAEVTNPAVVQAAKDKLAAIKSKQVQFQMGQPANAQATINDLQQQLAQIRAQKQAVMQSANQPMPQYAPNDPKVVQMAQQLAEQMKPGSGRDREAVANQMAAAYEKLNQQAYVAWSQNVQSAKIELESLRRSEAETTDQIVRLSQTFKVAPSVHPTTAALPTASAPAAPKVASAEDIAAAMRAAIGGQPAGSVAPAPQSSGMFENPTNDPTISAGNQMLQRQRAAQVQSQLNDALQADTKIDQQIAAARNTSAPITIPAFGGGYGGPLAAQTQAPAGVMGAAQQVSALLKAKADNAAKIQALKAQLVGPVTATATAPVNNSPTASTPTIGAAQTPAAWWQRENPAPVGGM